MGKNRNAGGAADDEWRGLAATKPNAVDDDGMQTAKEVREIETPRLARQAESV
jgi:hypothetical protein